MWRLLAELFDPLEQPLPPALPRVLQPSSPATMDVEANIAGRPEYKRRRLDLVMRVHGLMQWLKTTSQEAVDHEKRILTTPAQRMFSLLSGHHLAEATALAVAYKDLRLATLVRGPVLVSDFVWSGEEGTGSTRPRGAGLTLP